MPDIAHDTGFVEVADRCWVARHTWHDVNVSVVGGERGLLVVDTHASERAARAVAEQVRALPGEVVGVVNTHEHVDHTFGNGVLRLTGSEPVPVYAHETAAERTAEHVRADRTFSSAMAVDLGDRFVELVHPGRGHTGGDLVVRVEDADVVLAGDLVEESALRGGMPGFGDDCYPMEWPATLDLLISLLTTGTVVVPGHGLPVGREFVEEQRSAIGVVAETIRDLASRGVPASEALGAAQWPYPVEELVHAVRRGYAALPRSSRSLPIV